MECFQENAKPQNAAEKGKKSWLRNSQDISTAMGYLEAAHSLQKTQNEPKLRIDEKRWALFS